MLRGSGFVNVNQEPERMCTDNTNSYRPTDNESFLNTNQREYFRDKLLAWKDDILKEAQGTIQFLQHSPTVIPSCNCA
jgi:hypothetical protein